MNATQLPFLVEAVLLVVAMILGGLLGRKAKPYGKVKLGFHLFFFAWFTMGYYFIAQLLFTNQAWTAAGLAVAIMGVCLFVQIATGLWLLIAKSRPRFLPLIHGTSASLVLIADVAAFFLSVVP